MLFHQKSVPLNIISWFSNLFLSASVFGVMILHIPPPETYSQADAPIIYEINQQINFPYHIDLKLEATSQNEITDIVFYYTFNGQNTVIYGKPTFEPGKKVEVHHKIETNNARYLPPGLIITWHCLITDSQGNAIETKKQVFSYLNPDLKWNKLESENFNIYWHNNNKNIITRVVSQTNILLNKSKKIFDFTVHPKINVTVINNDRKSMPPISNKASSTHLYSGFAFPEYQTAVINNPNKELLTHELIHIYLDQKVGIYKPLVPAWLNEGLANYFANNRTSIKDNYANETWFKLKNMHNVPGKPNDVRKFYSQSEKVVTYLVESYGEEKMNQLLTELSNGQKIDRAILKSYGFSINELDSLWKTNSIYSPENQIDIKSIFTVIILTFIFVFTFGIIILYKRKSNSNLIS